MRIIGNDPSVPRQEHAVASGTMTNGTAVIVNADGTVSTVSGSDTTSGTAVQFESGNISRPKSAYDTTNNRVVIDYADLGNSYYDIRGANTKGVTANRTLTERVMSAPFFFHYDFSFIASNSGCHFSPDYEKTFNRRC